MLKVRSYPETTPVVQHGGFNYRQSKQKMNIKEFNSMSPEYMLYSSIMNGYKSVVQENHPNHIRNWPLISSSIDVLIGGYNDTRILIYRHVGRTNAIFRSKGIADDINKSIINVDEITESNKQEVRKLIEDYLSLDNKDGVIFLSPEISIPNEYYLLMKKHEKVMNIRPNKIFLSHKSVNKDFVRGVNDALKTIGYNTWLDEESMNAGANLNRSIMKGINDSCAVVFFITPDFKDEKYIANEIDHAIDEKTNRPDEFEIITIVIGDGLVPKILSKYVWKNVTTEIQAYTEIIKSLPIKVRDIY